MRLLMLNNEFPPLGGGTGTVNRALLERLAGVPDLEVDLVTSAAGRRAEEERFAERIRIRKVPVGTRDLHHAANRELLGYAGRALVAAFRLHRARPYDYREPRVMKHTRVSGEATERADVLGYAATGTVSPSA